MDATASFYETLGFEVERWDDTYAWVRHSGWEWFHLRLVESVSGNEASAYLHVDNAQGWHAAMTTRAPEIEIAEPAPMPWGKHEFALRDPSGNLVRIGSPL